MPDRARSMLILVMALLVAQSGAAADEPLAVNFVGVDPMLATAGQPDAEALGTLGDQGYGLVVNLAPPGSRGSVPEEAGLIAGQGITYVNIPVDWQRPTHAEFELFSAIMGNAADRKVLVHCQMNMRASVFTFLYRAVHGGVPAEEAFEAVEAVWRPGEQWAAFAASVLERAGIEFELPPAE